MGFWTDGRNFEKINPQKTGVGKKTCALRLGRTASIPALSFLFRVGPHGGETAENWLLLGWRANAILKILFPKTPLHD